MRSAHRVALLALAAAALAACDRPQGSTAYNNSGTSAAVAPGPVVDSTATRTHAASTSSTSTATSDTASPNVAPVASPEGAATETVTSAKIMTAITADSGMRDADITVKTENGIVTLGGTVKSQDQATLATDIARKHQGVARVESQIALK